MEPAICLFAEVLQRCQLNPACESATHLIGEPMDAGDLAAAPVPDVHVDGVVLRRLVLVEVPEIHCQREVRVLLRDRLQSRFANRGPAAAAQAPQVGGDLGVYVLVHRVRSGDEGHRVGVHTDVADPEPPCELVQTAGDVVDDRRAGPHRLLRGPGVIGTHNHCGTVVMVCLEGSCRCLEYDWVAGPGSFIFETPGLSHTLVSDHPEG